MDHVWLYKLINMEMQSLSVFMACGHEIVLCKWLCMPVSVYVEPWVLCGVFQAVAHLARCRWSSSQFSGNLHHCCVKKVCCSSFWWEAFYLEIWSSCIPKVLKHTNLILFQFYLCLRVCVCVCFRVGSSYSSLPWWVSTSDCSVLSLKDSCGVLSWETKGSEKNIWGIYRKEW